jgi:hypothetical protein
VKRLALAAALAFSACSSGSPVVPGGFRGPVAAAPFIGRNPATPEAGLVPLIAILSRRGSELRLLDPSGDKPVAGPNLAWALAIPTLQRPTFLAATSLGDGLADLVVVAGEEPKVQVIGTWLDGKSGYGVAATLDFSAVAGPGAQILSMVAVAVPGGPPAGTPPTAPTVPGMAWVVVGLIDVNDTAGGQLVVLEMARQPDGSIALSSAPLAKPIGFSPTAMTGAPDNVHLYLASQDVIRDSFGRSVLGIAEVDVGGGLGATWPVRGFDARNAPTFSVAAAFVGERTRENFYTFAAPTLRVYAALDPSGCGQERDIACGIATFDPAVGELAADPAVPGPAAWGVPTQSYRTPMFVDSLPIAMGIAPPASVPAAAAPSTPYGSQVCYSPAEAGVALPLCPYITEVATNPPFNGNGAGQKFMLQAPSTGQLWTSVVGLVTAIDGLAYVQDLGRFGPVNAVSMLNSEETRTKPLGAASVGPVGPVGNSSLFGFPDGTAALGLWLDGEVVSGSDDLAQAVTVWPGFTKDDRWLVSYQGVVPGIGQRRSVLGLSPDGTLYLGIQEAAVPSVDGVLPAASYWVPGVILASPDLGVHSVEKDGIPGDIGLLLLDNDPCPSTRPNWIPSGSTDPVFDPTKAPQAHEMVVLSLLAPDASLYPGGALRLAPAADPVLESEYQCLVSWLQRPENAGKVLTAFRNNPPSTDYARGAWVRAGGLILAGRLTGYAGRPLMDVSYQLAWADETGLSGEALVLARKARRFYYPASYPNRSYQPYPDMDDPMQPGPAVAFRVGRYCLSTVPGCDATTSLPARDAGVEFITQSGFVAMSRHPSSTAGGTSVTSFDKSIIPGLEYLGRVFYVTFTGDLVTMIPPGLDAGQTLSIR